MNSKILEKIFNITKDTKFLFLIIFVVVSTMLLESNYKKNEGVLISELKSAETRRTQLQVHLTRALASIEPLKASIEPLKNEIDNLRRIVLIEKTLSNAGRPKENGQMIWPGNPQVLSEGKTMPLPLPAVPVEIKSAPLQTRVPETGKSLMRLKDYIKEIEQQNGILKKKSDDLNNLLNKKENELAKLSSDNMALKKDLEEALQSQNKLKEELGAQLNNLERQLADRKKEVGELLNIKTNFEGRTTELTNRIAELIQINNNLEKQLALKDQDNSALRAEINKISGEISQQKIYADGLQKRIVEAKEEVGQKEKEKAELFRESAQLREFKKAAEQELAGLKSINSDKESQAGELNKRLSELNSSQDGLRQKIEELTGLIKRKEAQIKEGSDTIASLKNRMAGVLRERESFLSDLKGKEQVIAGLRAELVSVVDSQQNNIRQLAQFQESNMALKHRLMDFVQELELLRLEKGSQH
ncbi:MAG: hypothetical protein ABIH75_01610 [Candidatus Omnitrophota bacterium]